MKGILYNTRIKKFQGGGVSPIFTDVGNNNVMVSGYDNKYDYVFDTTKPESVYYRRANSNDNFGKVTYTDYNRNSATWDKESKDNGSATSPVLTGKRLMEMYNANKTEVTDPTGTIVKDKDNRNILEKVSDGVYDRIQSLEDDLEPSNPYLKVMYNANLTGLPSARDLVGFYGDTMDIAPSLVGASSKLYTGNSKEGLPEWDARKNSAKIVSTDIAAFILAKFGGKYIGGTLKSYVPKLTRKLPTYSTKIMNTFNIPYSSKPFKWLNTKGHGLIRKHVQQKAPKIIDVGAEIVEKKANKAARDMFGVR